MLRKVTVESGELQGVAGGNPRITVYKGVPYAAPPVGKYRWRGPQPVEKWEGVRMADHFGPVSMQGQLGMDQSEFYTRELHPTAYEYEMSEDCLYLNIWTPAASEDEKLPVFYYIHGGGYVGGYSYEMEFDGEQVAFKGVILVTVGYRLGALGFFAHKELEVEAPGESQGNFGLMDQAAGLAWVRRNIAAFGGDPDKITIGGQSAGAGSVTTLLTSPMTKGMFRGAIMMSGGGLNGVGSPFKPWRSLEKSQADGQLLLDTLHVNSVEEARRLPACVIAMTGLGMKPDGRSGPNLWGPTVDGCFLLEDSYPAMMEGRTHDVACLFGHTQDEGSLFHRMFKGMPAAKEEFEAEVRKEYGSSAERYLACAGVTCDEDVAKLYASSDYNPFTLFHGCFAGLLAEQGRDAYTYLFNHDIPGDDNAGSYHGSDLWFVFDSLGRNWRPFRGKHYDLARQVSSYWTNFVKYLDPNGRDSNGDMLPKWEKCTKEKLFVMEFADAPRELIREESELLRLRKLKYMGRLE